MSKHSLKGERVEMTDPSTGIHITQLTSYPTPSTHFGYAWPTITPDNQRVIFMSQRATQRDAPWDIFRCDTDGLDLVQLTRREGSPLATMTLDGATIYVTWADDPRLFAIDLESGEMAEVASLEAYSIEGPVQLKPHIAGEDRWVFVAIKSKAAPRGRLVRVDPRSGEVRDFGDTGLYYGYDFARERLLLNMNFRQDGIVVGPDGKRRLTNLHADEQAIHSTDLEGNDGRYMSATRLFGHSTPLGRTGKIQGTGVPPDRCIWTHDLGKEPEKLVEGPYFWHAGASFDGEWLLSDTNWPDVGLQLVHVPTRRFRTLCQNGATGSHALGGHPHPALSQDGRVAVFRSDRTHISQVYIAHISDEFRESVIAGKLDKETPAWI